MFGVDYIANFANSEIWGVNIEIWGLVKDLI